MTREQAEAIVIGSGFGGAVAAARLAQAGLDVLVLERGRRWHPGDFPRTPRLTGGWLWSVDRGLYDIRSMGRMFAVQAAGWGGGSLAYANVFSRAHDAALDPRWPPYLRRGALEPYYDLAAHMMGVARPGDDPRTGEPPARTALIERLMRDSDRPGVTVRPNLALTFGDPDTWRPNQHGVPRRGCAFVGQCVLGCNHGAKNSLDTTYLAVAERAGARAVTDAEVTRIETAEDGYVVITTTPSDPQAPPRRWHAPRVILAAGTVATTELLLRSRDVDRTLPRLSAQLGRGFSGNGDFLTIVEMPEPAGDLTTGPTITTTTVLDVPEGRGSAWYQVQDGAFPRELHELFDAVVPGQRARRWWRRRAGEPDLSRTFAVLGMGHDSGNGRLRLGRGGRVRVSWRNRWQSRLYRSQRRVGPMLSRLLGARRYHPLTWAVLRRTTTVHPIGGVPVGPDATSGVVDDIGEVHGYRGLYVMDGSVLPASTGVNPSATILAMAERAIETVIRRCGHPGWRAPEWDSVTAAAAPEDAAFAFAADLRDSTAGGGLSFAEQLVSRDRTSRLRLTAESASIATFVAEPAHPLGLHGTVDVAGVVVGAAVTGTLSLFPDGAREAMSYDLRFSDANGTPWRLTGIKTVTRRTPWRLLRDLTRLDVTVAPVGEPAQRTERLVIGPAAVVRLLSSIRGHGFTRARRVWTAARFAGFFVRSALRRPGPPASGQSMTA